MKINTFSLNKIGGRKNIEDAVMPKNYSHKDPKVFIVCDGVGGSSFGEVASDFAATSFYEIFIKNPIIKESDFENNLHNSLKLFKEKVADFIEKNPSATNTSTTLTLAIIQKNKAYFAWCGDSKIFLIRNSQPIFKSRDHSLVAELIAQGVISESEAITHPQRNIITRSLNCQTKPTDIEYKIINDLQPKDWVLLCTDGLMEQFTENLFPVVLNKFDSKVNYDDLIDKICYGKTKDNYSMYLIFINELEKSGTNNKKKLLLLVVFLIAIAVLGLTFLNINKRQSNTPTSTKTIKLEKENTDSIKSIMLKAPTSSLKIDSNNSKK